MDFRDVVEGMKEQVYESIPRTHDVWQRDVWEGVVRPQSAHGCRTLLRKHLNGDLSTVAGIKAFEAVRADLFGVRPIDAVDASITSFVPAPEAAGPSDVTEALDLARMHSAYKLYQWASLTQVGELVALCERVPDWHLHSYAPVINGTIGLLGHSAAVLECDVDTKPNFATLRDRVRLYMALQAFGERLLSVMINDSDGAAE